MSESAQEIRNELSDWWKTSISDITPGTIRLRGHAIEELMAEWDFVSVVALMATGKQLNPMQSQLLNVAMVASVDHGPQAPSIAAARMAATCGVGLNNAIASGVNMLGDVHGGAGQQCVELFEEISNRVKKGIDLDRAVEDVVAERKEHSKYLPGFGHRFHPRDPRRDPIISLLEHARKEQAISGAFLDIGLAVEKSINTGRRKPIPMNVDGATAIIYAELGFPAALARGLFVLARSVGILSHAYEESTTGIRIKGPMPKSILPRYTGE